MPGNHLGISKSLDNRLNFLRLFFIFLALVIIWRLFQLQVINYSWYYALASNQHDVLADLVPERGTIYVKDQINNDLISIAGDREVNLIYAVPKDIEDPVPVADKLAVLLNLDRDDLVSKLSKYNDPYEPIMHYAEKEVVDKIDGLNLVGIKHLPETKRHYSTSIFSQVVGFIGEDQNDAKRGRYGIEAYFEQELAGRYGRLRAEKDVAGGLIAVGEHDLDPKIDGSDLVLTIDYNIQKFACEAFGQAVVRHEADSGSLIIISPVTGEIEALCNWPSFDPNNYGKVATSDIGVFSNPVVSNPYEPGSVFKPITMAAALHSGAVTPTTTYFDNGEVKIADKVIKNSDGKANGQQTMINVLEKSLNTGAIFIMRQAGANNFINMIKAFGFGHNTGISLPAENAGNISSLSDEREIYLATASFGQGITVTPLQLAAAYAAIANQGDLMKPYIVKEIITPQGQTQITHPQKVRNIISAIEARILTSMMVTVIESGHGKRAGVPGYYIAGKTGTAQVPLHDKAGYDPNKTIGTFVGFGPVDQPRFVMLVKIDNPKDVKFAESTAAPVFGEVAKFLLDYYQIAPSRTLY